jgi:hypothetical protein
LGVKVVVHEAGYQRSFADGLFAEEDELELAQGIREGCFGHSALLVREGKFPLKNRGLNYVLLGRLWL